MKIISLFAFAILLLSGCTAGKDNNAGAQSSASPNIILILSDDMGYSDLGCYGGEVETPNLDALAANGLRFTQFYNGARCCPTRASLMTGCYPHQTGIGHMTNTPADFSQHDLGIPEYRGFLNKNCVTIAEVLKDAGYTTLMTGKWHLGISDKSKWPLQRGFDKFYGLIPGASNFFKPVYPRGITYMNDTISVTDEDYYTTDAFTDYAIQFIDEAKSENSEKPFFLYLAYTAPHWPLNAPQEDVEKYKGTYMDGWTKLRETRYARMKEIGIVDQGWDLSPQNWREWDSLSEEKKAEMDLRRATYSAQVDRMDQNIGKLVDHLKEQNIFDNTLIIFLNDNGACAEGGELGGGPARQLVTKEGYFLTYGGAWANASNTPYREYKHWVHEGGIGTPFIVHWPGVIPKEKEGQMISEYGFLPDLMATFVDVAQTAYPKEYDGNTIVSTPGKSLVPLFKGENKRIHTEPIFWEHEGNKAVRLGKYKLVSKWNSAQETTWELYNMETDRSEMHDLASSETEKVEEMAAMYDNWAKTNHVLPWNQVQELYRKKNAEK
ncbi:arylsulfatase [Draconibacterium orientale]|uniref:Arylsulfatase n=1 Tax=Draconibacterium orientale TaxID=1168034 RepID=X5DD06_9BACT|nr:arylsulfatase [Draconibacterium orientale]AHW58844.1 arylsulfatase [Draconibacterium orientale]SET93713.1 arylsulfatase [Draconibacterium orientale]